MSIPIAVYREASIISRQTPTEDKSKPYSCRVRITSPTADSHRTSICEETTIPTCRSMADAGVPACHSHNKAVVYGGTSNAVMSDKFEVDCDLEIERGLEIVHGDAPYRTSDNLIYMVEQERIKAVSVGLYDGWYWCNKCEVDMFDYSQGCKHWPGDKIVIKKDGKDEVFEIIPKIKDAKLGEVSTCYAGSNPDAIIVARAEDHLSGGLLTRKQAFNINRVFGMSLDIQRAKTDSNQGRTIIGGIQMPFEKADLDQIREVVREVVGAATPAAPVTPSPAPAPADAPIPKAIEDRFTKLETEKATLETELAEIKKTTVDSEKQGVVSEARKLYIELRGNNVTSESLREQEDKWDRLTLAQVQDERDMMKSHLEAIKKADEAEGGERKTKDEDRKEFDEVLNPGNPDWVADQEPEPADNDTKLV